ncbi:alpha-beta hydrolase superfamily lysophospholipase [Crossiella equi]|uniref:Alpha-beta hydrolase superfamily lysophospholipase n=1 Tax=Crossiella equi TaxID=130796 RepID=A0ABS5AMK1_9PSEU|nr:hypothetical protein [Crossiella equi]MBP2477802.1 alpha-beta hydrolase superfamily lysophospholipase [Crossiella equi]
MVSSTNELEHRVAELDGKYEAFLGHLRQIGTEPVVVDMDGCGAVHVDAAGRLLTVQLGERARMLSEEALATRLVAAVHEAERRARQRIHDARISYVDSVR